MTEIKPSYLTDLASRLRTMMECSPPDIAECLIEVWENIMLGRKWAEGRTDCDIKQQMAGVITIRVTKNAVNVDKNFEVTHPKSVYRRT